MTEALQGVPGVLTRAGLRQLRRHGSQHAVHGVQEVVAAGETRVGIGLQGLAHDLLHHGRQLAAKAVDPLVRPAVLGLGHHIFALAVVYGLADHELQDALDMFRRRCLSVPLSVTETLQAWHRAATEVVLTRGVLIP